MPGIVRGLWNNGIDCLTDFSSGINLSIELTVLAVDSRRIIIKKYIQSGFGRFFIAYMDVGMSREGRSPKGHVLDVVMLRILI